MGWKGWMGGWRAVVVMVVVMGVKLQKFRRSERKRDLCDENLARAEIFVGPDALYHAVPKDSVLCCHFILMRILY
jgi:hypothetical protein